MLNKNTIQIMQESVKLDNEVFQNELNQEAEREIEEFFEGALEMRDHFQYVPQAVPVMVKETYTGIENYVEYDNIEKLAESMNCSIKEAIQSVCEANEDMSISNTILVFDEKCSVKEALKSTSKKGKGKIKKAIDDIKKCGVKVATKCSSKKRRM